MAGGVPAGRLSIEIVAEIARLQQDLDKAKRLVNSASGDIAKSARAANDNIASMGKSSRLAGHHLQNLSFQLQDVIIGLQGGQKPMTVFMQQGSQISQIMMQAGVGIGGMVKQVAGMAGAFLLAHPAIAATAAVAGVATAAFALMATEINKNSDVTVTWKDVALGAWDAMKASLVDGLAKGFEFFGTTASAVWEKVVSVTKWAVNWMIGVVTLVPRNIVTAFQVLPAGIADAFYSSVNLAIRGINSLVEKAVAAINGFANLVNPVLSKVGLSIGTLTAPKIGEVKNAYAGAGMAAGKAFLTNITDTVTRDFISEGAAFIKPYAIARAKKRMEEEGKKAGKAAGKGIADGIKSETDKIAQALSKWLDESITGIIKRTREWQNDLPSFLEQEKQAADAAARVREGQLETEYRLLGVYLDQLDAIRQMGGTFNTIGGIIQGIGTGNFMSVGGKLGGLLGTIGSVDTGVWAESKFGAAGNELDKPERIGTTIADHLTKVFRDNGPFFQAFKSILANAAIGSTAANLTGGSKLGGAIGGALGGKLGKNLLEKPLTDALGKTLGSFAGPLGSMLGGVLGGAIGGMFKKVKWGAVDISASGVSASRGNSSTAEKAAVSVGDNVISSLNQIAEAFGGVLSDFGNITIGQRHGDWRVNTGGTSLKIKKGATEFDDDAEGAIAFAIQTAIERGAITGIRASTQKLLRASGDLQTKLQKALSFEGVFDELESRLNPTGYALEKLGKEFDSLRKIFAEAGATTEEYAKLEQLFALKRQDAMEDASSALKDFLKSMNMGSSSPLSLRSQEASAKALLDPFLAQINAGQTINQDKYLEAAQTYLDIERQIYGSTAKYFEAFDAIQTATNKAIAAVDNVAPIRTEADPFIEETANATKSMQADTSNMVTLLEKIRAALEEKSQTADSGFIGTNRNYA